MIAGAVEVVVMAIEMVAKVEGELLARDRLNR